MGSGMHRDTHHKALQINLEPTIYGTLAEIGAGQEVARWFWRVGGASGTVAKTISAYDMTVSDAIYGKVGRYVSRDRMVGMLDHEFALLQERLDATRGPSTRFFVFADTVAARSFTRANECHGWLGLRFQASPGAAPSDILLHVNLMDPTNVQQQEALGMFGVNLIHAAFYHPRPPEELLARLLDGLSSARIEIDVLELAGPAFAGVDGATIMLELVRGACAEAVLFGRDGRTPPPSEVLHQHPLVLVPGVFLRVEPVFAELITAAQARLARELGDEARPPLPLFVLTPGRPSDPAPATADLQARIAALRGLGFDVLVARHPQVYRIAGYATRYTEAPIRLALSVLTAAQLFEEHRYGDLGGQLLEAIAKLFAYRVRAYVWPMPGAVFRSLAAGSAVETWMAAPSDATLISTADLRLPHPLAHLYEYLMDTGFLTPL